MSLFFQGIPTQRIWAMHKYLFILGIGFISLTSLHFSEVVITNLILLFKKASIPAGP
jgi:hypothetical protein